MKRLIVNADDFGFTRDVNAGIVEAHRRGILTATTLMANGGAFDDAVGLARACPELDVGCHLVLIGGESLLNRGRSLPANLPELLKAVMRGRLLPYEELKPQVDRIFQAGIRPTHLDTHKHTHLLPQVLDAVARLAEEYRIRWVRRPFDFPLTGAASVPWGIRAVSRLMQGFRQQFHRALSRRGCLTTDHFAGFQMTGRFRARELVSLIRNLPEGTTEFMCHPGRCTDELLAARTRLKRSREDELQALISAEVRAAILDEQIELIGYRHLADACII